MFQIRPNKTLLNTILLTEADCERSEKHKYGEADLTAVKRRRDPELRVVLGQVCTQFNFFKYVQRTKRGNEWISLCFRIRVQKI